MLSPAHPGKAKEGEGEGEGDGDGDPRALVGPPPNGSVLAASRDLCKLTRQQQGVITSCRPKWTDRQQQTHQPRKFIASVMTSEGGSAPRVAVTGLE